MTHKAKVNRLAAQHSSIDLGVRARDAKSVNRTAKARRKPKAR
jgi:hypothetical protein